MINGFSGAADIRCLVLSETIQCGDPIGFRHRWKIERRLNVKFENHAAQYTHLSEVYELGCAFTHDVDA